MSTFESDFWQTQPEPIPAQGTAPTGLSEEEALLRQRRSLEKQGRLSRGMKRITEIDTEERASRAAARQQGMVDQSQTYAEQTREAHHLAAQRAFTEHLQDLNRSRANAVRRMMADSGASGLAANTAARLVQDPLTPENNETLHDLIRIAQFHPDERARESAVADAVRFMPRAGGAVEDMDEWVASALEFMRDPHLASSALSFIDSQRSDHPLLGLLTTQRENIDRGTLRALEGDEEARKAERDHIADMARFDAEKRRVVAAWSAWDSEGIAGGMVAGGSFPERVLGRAAQFGITVNRALGVDQEAADALFEKFGRQAYSIISGAREATTRTLRAGQNLVWGSLDIAGVVPEEERRRWDETAAQMARAQDIFNAANAEINPGMAGQVLASFGGMLADLPLILTGAKIAPGLSSVLTKSGIKQGTALHTALLNAGGMAPLGASISLTEGPTAGLIEVAVPMLFGARGMQALFSGPGSVLSHTHSRRVVTALAKVAAENAGSEFSQEFIIGAAHYLTRWARGEEGDFNIAQMLEEAITGGLAGALGGGFIGTAMQGSAAVQQARRNQIMDALDAQLRADADAEQRSQRREKATVRPRRGQQVDPESAAAPEGQRRIGPEQESDASRQARERTVNELQQRMQNLARKLSAAEALRTDQGAPEGESQAAAYAEERLRAAKERLQKTLDNLPQFAGLDPAFFDGVVEFAADIASRALETLTNDPRAAELLRLRESAAIDPASKLIAMARGGNTLLRDLTSMVTGRRGILQRGAVHDTNALKKTIKRMQRAGTLTPAMLQDVEVAMFGDSKALIRPPNEQQIRENVEAKDAYAGRVFELAAKNQARDYVRSKTKAANAHATAARAGEVNSATKLARAEATKQGLKGAGREALINKLAAEARQRVNTERDTAIKQAEKDAKQMFNARKMREAAVNAAVAQGMDAAQAAMQAQIEELHRVQRAAADRLPGDLQAKMRPVRARIDSLTALLAQYPAGLMKDSTVDTLLLNLETYGTMAYEFFESPDARRRIQRQATEFNRKLAGVQGIEAAPVMQEVYNELRDRFSYESIQQDLADRSDSKQRTAEYKKEVASKLKLVEPGGQVGTVRAFDTNVIEGFVPSDASIAEVMSEIFHIAEHASKTPAGSLLHADLGILKKRGQLPKSISEALGVITDPVTRGRITALKQAAIVGTVQAQHAFAQQYPDIFFDRTAKSRPADASVEIRAPGPLQGKMTYPQVQAALDGKVIDRSNMLSKALLTVNHLWGMQKTVGNAAVWARNTVGGVLLSHENAHLFHEAKSWRADARDTIYSIMGIDGVSATGQMAQQEGLIGSDVGVGMSREVADVLAGSLTEQFTPKVEGMARGVGRKTRAALAKAGITATQLYGYMDSAAKVHAFRVEYNRALRRGLSEAKAQTEAGQLVRDLYPTWTQAWGFTRGFSRNVPLLGRFMFWNLEMARTAGNRVKHTARLLKDPKTRVQGLELLATQMSGMALNAMLNPKLGGAATIWLLSRMTGISEEATESLIPLIQHPFSNDRQIPVSVRQVDVDGILQPVVGTANFNTTTPTAQVYDPVTFALKGVGQAFVGDVSGAGESFLDAAVSAYSTFGSQLGASGSAQLIATLVSGRDQYGREVNRFMHALQDLTPSEALEIYNRLAVDGQANMRGFGAIRSGMDGTYFLRFASLLLREIAPAEMIIQELSWADRISDPEERVREVNYSLERLQGFRVFLDEQGSPGETNDLLRQVLAARARNTLRSRALLDRFINNTRVDMPSSTGAQPTRLKKAVIRAGLLSHSQIVSIMHGQFRDDMRAWSETRKERDRPTSWKDAGDEREAQAINAIANRFGRADRDIISGIGRRRFVEEGFQIPANRAENFARKLRSALREAQAAALRGE